MDDAVRRSVERRRISTLEYPEASEEAGFKGLKNGRLLQAASGQYEVLVTVDQNLQYQQNLKNFAVAIIVLKAKRSTYPLLKPLMPQVLEVLEKIKPGEMIVVS